MLRSESALDFEALRHDADEYLRNVLQRSQDSGHDLAHTITGLAFDDDNPLRALFLAVAANASHPTTAASPTDTVHVRGSNKALSWLTRARGESSSADKSAGAQSRKQQQPRSALLASRHAPGTQTAGWPRETAAANDHTDTEETPDDPLPSGQNKSHRFAKLAKSSTTATYNCVLCNCDLSSKGVCKRHLEDQHIVMKIYECEKCRMSFESKAKAKKHCGECGAGVFYFVAVRPETKKLYACEFTGKLFRSLKTYTEHMIQLCERGAERPQRSVHRKLRALISQPALQSGLRETSNSVYSSPEAWRHISWPENILHNAIRQLEFSIVHDDASISFTGPSGREERQDISRYLTDLLCAGKLSGNHGPATHDEDSTMYDSSDPPKPSISSSSSSAVHDRGPPEHFPLASSGSNERGTLAANSRSVAHDGWRSGETQHEQSGKRPRSLEGHPAVPGRQPPGPPAALSQNPPQIGNPIPSHFLTPDASALQDPAAFNLPYRQNYVDEPTVLPRLATPGQMPFGIREMPGNMLSATSSEITVARSYQEPELVAQQSYQDYWGTAPLPAHAQYTLHDQDAQLYGFADQTYFPATHPGSGRTPSVSTGETYNVSVDENFKMPSDSGAPPNMHFGHYGSNF